MIGGEIVDLPRAKYKPESGKRAAAGMIAGREVQKKCILD